MSNGRRGARGNAYRAGFLRSDAWFARRARWFREEHARTPGPVRCAGCGKPAEDDALELHHVDYAGVQRTERGWEAWEPHDNLWPMHPACHEYVHRLLDRDKLLRRFRSRRVATQRAIATLRARLDRTREK